MAQHIGIDIGSGTVTIYLKDKGIVLREPSIAAVDTKGTVVAVGTKALLIHGRSPGTTTLRRPIEAGGITDFNLVAEALDRFIELAAPKGKKQVTAAVKYSYDSRTREALTNALADCRSGKIVLSDSATAALFGSGYAPSGNEEGEYDGSVVCDIGADSVEVSYIRKGELMRSKTVKGAGNAADMAIVAYIRRKYGLAITSAAANEAKHKLSLCTDSLPSHTFIGTDGSSGMPRKISVNLTELIRPCIPQTDHVVSLIKDMLSNLPHHGENVSVANRIILVGGGASLPGLADYIAEKLGRAVVAADNPSDCVALGLGKLIEQSRK